MTSHTDAFVGAPTLDRAGDPWIASFPGLGTVLVAADGTIAVEVQSAGTESSEKRERALRYGWGEPLSFARRGYDWALGAAVTHPDIHDVCLLLHGDPHDAAILMIHLSLRGWGVMADRITPVVWQGDVLVAHHRDAPLLVSRRRADKAHLPGIPVRDNTDSMEIELPRSMGSRRVAAIVALERRKLDQTAFEQLSGQGRFKVASELSPSPFKVASTAPEPEQRLTAHLRLAALPIARMRFDTSTIEIDVDTLADWWQSFAEDGSQEPR